MSSIRLFYDKKHRGEKLVMLTAYDYPMAQVLSQAGVDAILVGDSVGNVVLGNPNTLSVTMDQMIAHTQAVVRGAGTTLVVSDMPFLSYQVSDDGCLQNAGRFLKEGGAGAVKMEVNVTQIDRVKKVIDIGIPVLAHIGFTPQSVNQLGGYRVQGRTESEAQVLVELAVALEKVGVFGIVLEMVPSAVAATVTRAVSIPTLGVGAGVDCDGQVLVTHDLIGFGLTKPPKFAKQYTNVSQQIMQAVTKFKADVQSGIFPGPDNQF